MRPGIMVIVLGLTVLFANCERGKQTPEVTSNTPELCRLPEKTETRWASFENQSATKGSGGMENKGAKGHAFESLAPGETKVLLDVQGCGTINRIWMTMNRREPSLLRAIRIEMYWDNAPTPAVSAPLGDFFGYILGHAESFDNELFSNPNGRAFNCYIPMPFRTAARIVLVNDSDRLVRQLYYDVDFTLTAEQPDDMLYFHVHWNRERWTTLGEDFQILPLVKGKGRFLGAHVGVITNPVNKGWWGEGEVSVFLDGDDAHPTLAGTGTEDYMGAAWGMPVFKNRYQGCLLNDDIKGRYGFYRYHVPDPIYFYTDCRVTIEQIGCLDRKTVLELMDKSVPLKVHSIFYASGEKGQFVSLLDQDPEVDFRTLNMPEGYTEEYLFYYRCDDWSSVALFYLDNPENGLPPIAGVKERVESIDTAAE